MSTAWILATAQTVMLFAIVAWAAWATHTLFDALDAANDTHNMQLETYEILRDWWAETADADALERNPEPQRTDTEPAATRITPQAVAADLDAETWARAEVDRIWRNHTQPVTHTAPTKEQRDA